MLTTAGRDLDGNTYWEFSDLRHNQSAAMANVQPGDGIRMRRIVKYPRGTHPGTVMVPPQWHQWLRHVRKDAPTIEEQQREVARQAQMRILAARADARWAGAKRVDGPVEAFAAVAAKPAAAEPPAAAIATGDAQAQAHAEPEPKPEPEPVPAHVYAQPKQPRQQQPTPENDPWKREELAQGHGALGETWQPAQWTPPASKR